jgi:hypothetical protein
MKDLAESIIAGESPAEEERKARNRKERRQHIRGLRKLVQPAGSLTTWQHPLTDEDTPYAVRERQKRRARDKRDRAARKKNR